jgi:hypothetical protein
MTLKVLINKIKCLSGYHEYQKYEVYQIGKPKIGDAMICKHCGKELYMIMGSYTAKETNHDR